MQIFRLAGATSLALLAAPALSLLCGVASAQDTPVTLRFSH
jgi:hypothetical protein